MATLDEALNFNPAVKEAYAQLDAAKLETALAAVESLGNGTQVYYRQDFMIYRDEEPEPVRTDLYITVKLTRAFLEGEARLYGGLYAPPSVHSALNYLIMQLCNRNGEHGKQ